MELNKTQRQMLAKIVTVTLAVEVDKAEGAKHLMYTPSAIAKLKELGLVEQNPGVTEGSKLATRATAKGQTFLEAPVEAPVETFGTQTEAVGASTEAVANTSAFELEDGIEIPARRRAVGAGKYPFDQMQVGQSFHVAMTEAKPNPAKSMASTCSGATRRHTVTDVVTGVKTVNRKFVVRNVGEEDPKGPGARVFREI